MSGVEEHSAGGCAVSGADETGGGKFAVIVRC